MRTRVKTAPRRARVIGVIPARWGSTRLPGKSLIPLCGKPLIQWVVERAAQARRLDRLIVATDDRRIADVVRAIGAEAVMTRPDHPSGTDRVAEAVRGMRADVVINIQGDEPTIEPALIDMLADAMIAEPEWDMATAAAPFARPEDAAPSSVVKVVFAAAGRALYFSRWPIPFVRDAPPPAGETTHWLHVGIYAYRRAFLAKFVRAAPSPLERLEKLEQLRALHLGGAIKVVCTAARGIGVDTPEDVKKVEAILRKEYRGKSVEGRGPI